MSRFDLHPAAAELSRLVEGTRDDQLSGPTPLDGTPVRGLLIHIGRFSRAFAAAASKTPYGDGASSPVFTDEHLPRTGARPYRGGSAEAAAAWVDEAAWEGTASAGGVKASAAEIGVIALGELVVHGWDLARATEQSFGCDATSIAAVLGFTKAIATGPRDQRAGLFGAAVDVPDDASDLDRALGYAGQPTGLGTRERGWLSSPLDSSQRP